MPRFVRNFWIEVTADGVQPIATGPRSADGGARVIIRNRAHGAVDENVIEIQCRCDEDGNILIDVYRDGAHMFSKIASR